MNEDTTKVIIYRNQTAKAFDDLIYEYPEVFLSIVGGLITFIFLAHFCQKHGWRVRRWFKRRS